MSFFPSLIVFALHSYIEVFTQFSLNDIVAFHLIYLFFAFLHLEKNKRIQIEEPPENGSKSERGKTFHLLRKLELNHAKCEYKLDKHFTFEFHRENIPEVR
jgi:hypothetical protein